MKKATEKKEKTVTVFIPKTGREDSQRYVEVNGRSAVIATGKPVEVPAVFAACLKDAARQNESAREYIDRNRRD